MAFLFCPQCRGYRMHQEGKCNVCGYISSTRASLNYLYGSKGLKKNTKQRSTSNSKSSPKTYRDDISSIFTSSAVFVDYGSSGSDGGGSGDCF